VPRLAGLHEAFVEARLPIPAQKGRIPRRPGRAGSPSPPTGTGRAHASISDESARAPATVAPLGQTVQSASSSTAQASRRL